ncbi:hypothetical protein FRC12_013240, partial [Ceratobasidium sp. 428]
MDRLPYKCNSCRSRFRNKNLLQAHTLIHFRESDLDTPGAGPSTIYECPYCHRVLLSNAGLTQHINRMEACRLADEAADVPIFGQPAQEPHTPSEGSSQESQSEQDGGSGSEHTMASIHDNAAGSANASGEEENMGSNENEGGTSDADAANGGTGTNEDEGDSDSDNDNESDSDSDSGTRS